MASHNKVIAITGSTRGIGLGMAREFLQRGHQVVISGRTPDSTANAVTQVSVSYADRVFGQACDVGDYAQVEALWDAAVAHFGRVDIWINNAGISHPSQHFWTLPTNALADVVRTNLLGVMYGSKVAIAGMLQQGFGQLYNMEGLGSAGPISPGLILYGATKSALTYFTKGLVKELEGQPVQVGFLSPGMVVTDLLIGGETLSESSRSRRVFNILADRVETVAPFLVEGILSNNKHGARIAWLTTPKIAWRFLTARYSKRDVFTPETTS
jgi:NAD(P)-dependent dehydrogenase (short-subunit alcohol dehydrogenase family)